MTTSMDILPAMFGADLDSSCDLRSVASGHHNLLLEGPADWTAAVLQTLTPLLDAPILWTTSQMLGSLPAGECVTLVLQDIAELRRGDQARLFEWLDEGGRHVISTTRHSLFAAVASSGFDEALYYRLNVIRMCAPSRSSPGIAASVSLLRPLPSR